MVSFKLTELEKNALICISKKEGVSMTGYIREVLKEKVHHYMVAQRMSYVQALKKLTEEEKE